MSFYRNIYPLQVLLQKFLATISSWRENTEKHMGKTQSVEMSDLISVSQFEF